MELKKIRTKKEYQAYLDWVDEKFDQKIKPASPQGEKLQVALLLIEKYEDEHYPVPLPDAIEAVKLKMQEKGIKSKDLVGKIGSKSYISSLLNKKKPLTLEIAKVFYRELGVPADILLS